MSVYINNSNIYQEINYRKLSVHIKATSKILLYRALHIIQTLIISDQST